jgi:prevent-host-death family protein
MRTTNATEFQKRVGEFSDIARREPVTVTRHGRPSLVLLSAEDYQRLKQIEERSTKAIKTTELRQETIEAMLNADLSHLPTN